MKISKFLYIAFFTTLLGSSCSDEILDENPESFLVPENALVNEDGFSAAVAELHRLSRGLRTTETISQEEFVLSGERLEPDKAATTLYASGTDLASFIVPGQTNQFTDYSAINAVNPYVDALWNLLYKIVSNSNIIVESLENVALEEDVELKIEANARFFRAFAYRYLVYLWGDVPLTLEALTGPKFNFSRAPVADVLNQMTEDLEFASIHLPQSNPGNGELSKAAADHLLSETLISLGDFENAIVAASNVINDGQYSLMTSRFGAHTNLEGDVFWDLFRAGNQNRSSGNTEAIWIWNQDFVVLNGMPDYRATRAWRPQTERLRGENDESLVIDTDTIGRGVGFVRPTRFLDSLVWETDFENDIRNSKFNMQRRFFVNNPDSPDFGELIVPKESDLLRHHFVYVKKMAAPEGYVQGFDRLGRLFTDIYAIRLAETYLLRAEARLLNGDITGATSDINILRARANAALVSEAEVDLDYLLDERVRELVAEEPRRLTLARTNTLVDRVRRYNLGTAFPTFDGSSASIQDFHQFYPIPQSSIDANIEADLQQNPGY